MKHWRIFVCIVLVAVAIGSFSYASKLWAENREEIMIQVAEIFEDLALPFRLAKLESMPRDERLLMPIRDVRAREVADTWGAARSEGRTHEGVDIFAPKGAPVYSATYGYVVRVGANNLGGNFVMIAGAGGYRYYYAHLDSVALGIERGEEVTTDTVLGFVGNTGNAESTAPHLHLGMYKAGAHNPFPLLADRP